MLVPQEPIPGPFLKVSHCWQSWELEQVSWHTCLGTILQSAVVPTRQSLIGMLVHFWRLTVWSHTFLL